jgi:hypothetical protein
VYCEACRKAEHVTRLSKAAAAACWRLERQGPSEAMEGGRVVDCLLVVRRWLSVVGSRSARPARSARPTALSGLLPPATCPSDDYATHHNRARSWSTSRSPTTMPVQRTANLRRRSQLPALGSQRRYGCSPDQPTRAAAGSPPCPPMDPFPFPLGSSQSLGSPDTSQIFSPHAAGDEASSRREPLDLHSPFPAIASHEAIAESLGVRWNEL